MNEDQHPSESQDDFLKRMVDKMFDNPAITCPIKFAWTGNQELAERASTLIRLHAEVQQDCHPWMSFKNLTEISFYDDYEQGLRDASNTDAAIRPTREEGGFSVGMLVRGGKDLTSKLVMHSSVAHGFLSEDVDHGDFATRVIRHELCHVHDNSFKMSLILRDELENARDVLEGRFLSMAESLWAEYFANKYSYGPWSKPEHDFELVIGAIQAVGAEIQAAIIEYRTSGDLDSLLALSEQKIRFLVQCFGYALGQVAALHKPIEVLSPDLANALESKGLRVYWDLAFDKLETLDKSRPNWNSYWEITMLIEVAKGVMAAHGLRYSLLPDGGLYVDVPYSPETLPADGPSAAFQSLVQINAGWSKLIADIVARGKTGS
jgi:hypothetical protein